MLPVAGGPALGVSRVSLPAAGVLVAAARAALAVGVASTAVLVHRLCAHARLVYVPRVAR